MFLAEWWPREQKKGRKLRGPAQYFGDFHVSTRFFVAFFAFFTGVPGIASGDLDSVTHSRPPSVALHASSDLESGFSW